jgi:hypothetical protein
MLTAPREDLRVFIVLFSISGYAFPTLRNVEDILPEHDVAINKGD